MDWLLLACDFFACDYFFFNVVYYVSKNELAFFFVGLYQSG